MRLANVYNTLIEQVEELLTEAFYYYRHPGTFQASIYDSEGGGVELLSITLEAKSHTNTGSPGDYDYWYNRKPQWTAVVNVNQDVADNGGDYTHRLARSLVSNLLNNKIAIVKLAQDQ